MPPQLDSRNGFRWVCGVGDTTEATIPLGVRQVATIMEERKGFQKYFGMCQRGILWVLLAAFLPGCGYTLSHRLTATFDKAKHGVFVPVFSNATDEVGAEQVFTNALIRELQSRGELKVTARESALAVLEGTLTSISVNQTAYTDQGFHGLQSYRRLPSEYEVAVDLALRLIDTKSNAVLWSNSFRSFQRLAAPVSRTYSYEAASSTGLITQSIIDNSYQSIARNIMRDVYDEMVEIF